MLHPLTIYTDLVQQSDLFLLATLLGSVSKAERLLKRHNTLYRLSKASLGEIRESGELSQDQALRVLSAFQISHRVKVDDLKPFLATEPSQMAKYLQELIGHLNREVFVVVYLSTQNEVLHEEIIFQGTTKAVLVDIRLILERALRFPTTGIILAHNHPSGSLKPSQSDLKVTKQIKLAADIFDIELIDHVIVSERGYYSLAEEGKLC